MNSLAKCIFRLFGQSCYFRRITEMNSLARHIFRLSGQSWYFRNITGIDSQTGCIFRLFDQLWYFRKIAKVDSQTGCIFRLSGQSCYFRKMTERLTTWMHFQIVWSVMLFQKNDRKTHNLDAFSDCLVSDAISEKWQRDSLSGCIFKLFGQSWYFRRMTEINSLPGCILSCLVSHAISEKSQRQTYSLDAFQVVWSVMIL